MVTLVVIFSFFTLNLRILVLVHPLIIEIANPLIKMTTIPTNTTTILLTPTLVAVLGMINIINTYVLLIDPTTLLLALLLDITPTLVVVLIVATQGITLTLSDLTKHHIALLRNHDIIDPVLTITIIRNFNQL